MNILLVDDSRTMRNIQKKTLGALAGVHFSEANDGVEAMTILSASPSGFDLILIDWNMPNMNGLQLVQKIRETDKKTILVMVTTETDKTRVVDALRAGVNNFMIKPFAPPALLEKIQQTLAKAKAA